MTATDKHKALLFRLMEESARMLKNPWAGQIDIEIKADASPVTEFDRNVELRLRELIAEEFPEHGVVGEEYGHHNFGADWTWVLDPIDGTKSFIGQVPLFTTLIALRCGELPVLGAIVQPQLDLQLWGDGQMSWLNGRRAIYERPVSELRDAILLYTDLIDIEKHQNLSGFINLARNVRYSRSWGDGFGYLQLSRNLGDIMVDPIMNEWDIMALIPIVTGAGLTITDFQGSPAYKGSSTVASPAKLHNHVLEILNHV